MLDAKKQQLNQRKTGNIFLITEHLTGNFGVQWRKELYVET